MSAPHAATSTLVALAWLQALGLPDVGTSLPSPDKWETSGFVVVGATLADAPNIYYMDRRPVVEISCYAKFPGQSEKVNYALANDLAEQVLRGTYTTPPPAITLRAGYEPVHLSSVYAVSDIRWVPEPDNNFARYALDVHIGWMPQGAVLGS